MISAPATCELCGAWLPGHSSSCPRNGVHPSQWSLGFDDMSIESDAIDFDKHSYSILDCSSAFRNEIKKTNDDRQRQIKQSFLQ